MNDEWRVRAACRGVDVNLFFPAPGDGTTVRQALAVCNGDNMTAPCPVKDDCHKFIMGFQQDEDIAGIYAGLTSADRKKIRKEQKEQRESDLAVTPDRMLSGDTFTYQLGLLLNLIHNATVI